MIERTRCWLVSLFVRPRTNSTYVGALTGQTVGRSRKIRCPFHHEDKTPSFHAYEDPADGWFCFGCRRVGHSCYDLASELWGLDTTGPSFLELRARLYALLLPGHTPPGPPRSRVRRSPPDRATR
jgi:hypothetical protein